MIEELKQVLLEELNEVNALERQQTLDYALGRVLNPIDPLLQQQREEIEFLLMLLP